MPRLTSQRLTMLIFFLQPIAFGSWLPRIPDVQQALGLGPAGLALTLLGLPVGTLVTLPFAGRLAARVGSRALIRYGFLVYLAVVCLPAWSPAPWALFVALMLCGSAISALELGLNVKADEVEKSGAALIMSTCHGFWSLGIMAGSLLGALLAGAGLAPGWGVMAVAAIGLVALVPLWPLVPADTAHPPPPPGAARPSLRPPSLALLGICLFVFGITMTEGAMADWSAIFLRDELGMASAQAGIGYSVFALMVAVGRFCGDGLKARFGPVALARGAGILAVLGMLVLFRGNGYVLSLAGFGLVGLGVSVGFPLAVTAAAAQPDRPAATSVATLSFIALLGFLLGPPMIGIVAQMTGLRLGLATLVPFLLASLALTGMLTVRRRPISIEP